MKKLKNIIIYIIFFSLWIAIIFAADNYFKSGKNWDANVPTTENANDTWTLTGRLDLEDSRSDAYINDWYRGTLSWRLESPLFWAFYTSKPFILKLDKKYTDSATAKDEIDNKCYNWWSWDWNWPVPEIYMMSGWILSNWNRENIWWEFYTDFVSNSYFCSNKIMYLHLFSNTLWEKEVWTWVTQTWTVDDFRKQEIYIQGIANINWNENEWILARWDQDINKVKVYVWNNAIIKRNINKNISMIYKTYLNSPWNKASWDNISDFSNDYSKEYYYIYNYSSETEDINFDWTTYINKWKKLIIENSSTPNIVNVEGINTVIVQWWNIYIKSDIKNWDDTKDLLILIAKRDKTSWNWWNIYIDPDVTNIDAVLIADWSLISLALDNIQSAIDDVDNLRKQLLIYWRVLSANNVWTDDIPYWADLYENSAYPSNTMTWNIYDLWNLRTFNLNYGGGSNTDPLCNNPDKLTPINTPTNSWAWKKECYIDNPTNDWLRWSDKLNPLIIENNTHINFLNPFILRK